MDEAKKLFAYLSYVGLALTLIPAFLLFAEIVEADWCKKMTLTGAVLWFFPQIARTYYEEISSWAERRFS